MKRALVAATVSVLVGGLAIAAQQPAHAAPPTPQALAVSAAQTLVANRPASLHASAEDQFVQHATLTGRGGLQYVPYDRTYKGLPVYGGDFVVMTNSAGAVQNLSVQQTATINVSTTAKVAAGQAASTARTQAGSNTIDSVSTAQQTVLAIGTPRLAWEVVVVSHHGVEPSIKHVFVDANSGAVAYSYDKVADGNGTAAINGPNPVHLDTTLSGSTYSLKDPNHPSLVCQDAANNTTYTGPDDSWGNGTATDRETGCVDAMFSSQTEFKMLSAWLNRNGPDGNGGAWPLRVGLDDENAYYDGSQVQIGHNTAGQWIGALDVVAHEQGHGIDDHTPGGISGGGTQEFVADVFGASTETYASEPSPYDVPDFTVGEEINLVGSGPIRYMYNPSTNGDPNCYSSSIPGTEVHAAAGPGNHWSTCSPKARTRAGSPPVPPVTAAAAWSASVCRTPSRSSTTRC
jgi:Zn-dependent metalloprotease